MIVMLCHLDYFTGQEVCIPMTPEPQIYYNSKQKCMTTVEEKLEEMKTIAVYNNIKITNLYANCILDKSKSNT